MYVSVHIQALFVTFVIAMVPPAKFLESKEHDQFYDCNQSEFLQGSYTKHLLMNYSFLLEEAPIQIHLIMKHLLRVGSSPASRMLSCGQPRCEDDSKVPQTLEVHRASPCWNSMKWLKILPNKSWVRG